MQGCAALFTTCATSHLNQLLWMLLVIENKTTLPIPTRQRVVGEIDDVTTVEECLTVLQT
jgi:ABC-type glycerol-3-phosphate transport system permease component